MIKQRWRSRGRRKRREIDEGSEARDLERKSGILEREREREKSKTENEKEDR